MNWGRIIHTVVVLSACSAAPVWAGTPQIQTTLEDFFISGSQPTNETVAYDIFLDSQNCIICHELQDFGGAPTEIHKPWAGSMMAHSVRDPVFRANLTIANQDAAFSGDLCLRCHAPGAWLSNRSVPTDGSALEPIDMDGINCHVCHRQVDPVLRPTSPPPDEDILALISPLPDSPGNGNYIMDPIDRRRGPFELPEWFGGHSWEHSPYHQTSEMCGTCHDVSNPVFVRQEDGTYAPGALNQPHPTGDKHDMFPEQRTYSEWLHSDFASTGVDMQGRFGGPLNTVVSTCQDCHMPDVESRACFIPDIPIRPDIPSHAMAGGNSWVRQSVFDLYGESDGLNEDDLLAGTAESISMLQRACSLVVAQDQNHIITRVINETGHKLPTGYPEGRRMWVYVEFYNQAMLIIGRRGYYNPLTRTLSEDDTKVYETHQGIDEDMAALTGLPVGKSFHLVLNNKIFFDNRIPPRGFTNAAYESVQAEPVGYSYTDGQFWDDTDYRVPAGTHRAVVRVYFQTTSREYVEFLRDENSTDDLGQVVYDQWNKWGGSTPVLMAESEIVLDPYADGDYNSDFRVDLVDYSSLYSCLTAPGEPMPNPSCDVFDFDVDGDVDLEDLAEFSSAFDG